MTASESTRGRWARPVEGAHRDTSGLTAVQRDTLTRLAGGASYRQIADTLRIQRDAVKNRVQSLYRALGATGRDEALDIARSRGLIPTQAAPTATTEGDA